MKKAIFFVVILMFTIKSFAQAEPSNYATAITRFVLFYNNGQPDSIFSMFSPALRAELPIDKFKPSTLQLKSQLGRLVSTDFVKYNGKLAVYKATFQNSTFLLNLGLDAQGKFIGVALSPYEAAPKGIVIDPSLSESPILLKTLFGTIAGSLVMPKTAADKIPVVLIVGDAGPTDRDGNNAKTGLNANTYKLLAYELGKKGIATVRYDKRMVGQSVGTTKEKDLHIEDYSDDVVGWIGKLNDDQRFSKVILFGHGEGSLVSLLSIPDEPVKAFISAEGAAEQADKILADQMKSKPKFLADEFKTIMDSLRKGKVQNNVDPALYYIARPSIQPFLMSWCRYDPTRVIKRSKIPILIVQGTTDLQVSVDNADKLKKAKSEASLMIIKGMNHILKEAPADPEKNTATFADPDLPLKPELVTGIVDFINKVK